MVVVGAFWPSPGTVTTSRTLVSSSCHCPAPTTYYYNDVIDTIWNYNIPASLASADMKKLFRQT